MDVQLINDDVASTNGTMSEKFHDMVRHAFSFLESAGFSLTRVNVSQFRCDSARAVVVIGWDARSGELEAFLGLRQSTGQAPDIYALTDILGMEGVPNPKAPPPVADEGQLGPFVDRVASDIRVHAQPALVGDRMFFRRLETFRHANAKALTRSIAYKRISAQAEKA